MNHDLLKRVLAVCLLILVGALSCLLGARRLSAPELYAGQIASLDEKAETVLTLTASSTLASVGISAIPGDTATPIADKLADFSEYFLLILCVLYSEKYLLTIIPVGACRYLIPLVCALFALGRVRRSPALDHLGFKLLLVTLGLCVVIPLSVGASDMIYNAYRQSIDSTIASAGELNDETAALAEAEDQNVIQSILKRISETTESLTEKAAGILTRRQPLCRDPGRHDRDLLRHSPAGAAVLLLAHQQDHRRGSLRLRRPPRPPPLRRPRAGEGVCGGIKGRGTVLHRNQSLFLP